jgi:hypothetical protein
VVILDVDVDSVFTLPSERDSPVSAYADGIPLYAPQRMKVPARQVHIGWRLHGIQSDQDAPDTICVLNGQLRGIAFFSKSSKRSAAE